MVTETFISATRLHKNSAFRSLLWAWIHYNSVHNNCVLLFDLSRRHCDIFFSPINVFKASWKPSDCTRKEKRMTAATWRSSNNKHKSFLPLVIKSNSCHSVPKLNRSGQLVRRHHLVMSVSKYIDQSVTIERVICRDNIVNPIASYTVKYVLKLI